MKLTNDQKIKICIEMLNKETVQTIGQVAIIKLSEFAIENGAEEIEQSIEAYFFGKKYKCNMKITYEELTNEK